MNKLILLLIIGFAGFLFLPSCNNSNPDTQAKETANTPDNTPPNIDYTVIKSYPHDTSAYTEGFLFHDGQLYESTGTEPEMPADRRSLFGTVDLTTGKINPKVEIDRNKYFGEGIVFLDGKVYQLTYTTKVGFIYDAKTF